ncbi:MAG: GNAT family N-acetyltransferase [Thermoplasmata archaeon]|nr:GNAT family N-acetyltransferase [Thermoplasmata archaeon]
MNNDSMIIREAILEDVEELKKLDELCFGQQVQYDALQLLYYIIDPDSYTLIIDYNEKVIGFIIFSTAKPAGVANIVTLDVHPEFRRQGIASKLLNAAEQHITALHLKTITLQVGLSNVAAQNFYKKKGYSIERTIDEYYPTEDAYFMAKRLP